MPWLVIRDGCSVTVSNFSFGAHRFSYLGWCTQWDSGWVKGEPLFCNVGEGPPRPGHLSAVVIELSLFQNHTWKFIPLNSLSNVLLGKTQGLLHTQVWKPGSDRGHGKAAWEILPLHCPKDLLSPLWSPPSFEPFEHSTKASSWPQRAGAPGWLPCREFSTKALPACKFWIVHLGRHVD